MVLSSPDVARIAHQTLEDKKARDIIILDIREVSVIAEYFIICSGSSSTQVKALAEYVEKALKEKDIAVLRREGIREAHWVLLDYGAVVVHIFEEEDRAFYNLERLWGDAEVVHF